MSYCDDALDTRRYGAPAKQPNEVLVKTTLVGVCFMRIIYILTIVQCERFFKCCG